MQYKEELMWILDHPDVDIFDEAKYQQNIDFVHSLGKKCDCVCWSMLIPEAPRAEEILERIAAVCKEMGWKARGLYTREYENLETDWYAIQSVYFKDDVNRFLRNVPAQNGGTVAETEISAYRELITGPKAWGHSLYLPDRFRKACLKHSISGLDFWWVKDTGKYAAEQYFEVFGTRRIPKVATAWKLTNKELCKLGTDGGWLPRLAEVISEWAQINMPYCYRKEDLPAGGIAYAYIPSSYCCCGLYEVLVHKEVAQLLLQEKTISPGALQPIRIVDEIPGGYTLKDTEEYPRPLEEHLLQSLADYEKLVAKERPQRKISEKDALKVMRKAKTDRKEDFQKKLPKKREEELLETELAPLVPYYRVAGGGYLSDEYELLSPEDVRAETTEFFNLLMKEELLEEQPKGIVIVRCADGDKVLLCTDGKVIRFNHEAPEIAEEWSALAQFIFEAVSEE